MSSTESQLLSEEDFRLLQEQQEMAFYGASSLIEKTSFEMELETKKCVRETEENQQMKREKSRVYLSTGIFLVVL